MLIVDDESIIVDCMYQLFREAVHLDAEVYRAYTAHEALDLFRTTRIDLMLTDIRMPGMDGIELHRKVAALWPRCKVIYLTGHDDFSYAREAIRTGGVVDYVLKNEDDDVILQAVEKAFAVIDKQVHEEDELLRDGNKIRSSLSTLRQEALLKLVQGDPHIGGQLGEKFAEVDVPLRAGGYVYLILGRMDRGGKRSRRRRTGSCPPLRSRTL